MAINNAAALEMIHCYSLIHDDLPAMDDDDLRRGRPTCHIQFDEAMAILAGDALQALAFEIILADAINPSTAAMSCLVLAKAAGAEGMVGGQVDDLQAEKNGGDATFLENYGDCVGIAFQIVDDLLDVEGSSENTGKRTGKDHQRGKLTFPGIYGVQASRVRAEQFVEQAISNVEAFGPAARPLKQLAHYITARSH
jgi:geranylgeranyl diphosphate synthase type II